MIGDGQEFVDWMTKRLEADRAQTNGRAKATGREPAPALLLIGDDEILRQCRAAKNAAKFEDLYDRGDARAHHGGDESVADLALLSMLAYYTQDDEQLERLFSASPLGQREKWTKRSDYRRRTIEKALADLGEVYEWPMDIGNPPLGGLSSSPHAPTQDSDDDNSRDGAIVWFAELGEPKPREYLIEKIGVKGYPIVAFGAGGVAKSFGLLSAAIAVASASGVDEWLGLKVLEHGYVLYLDFELDVEEQHRRVRDLCEGMNIPTPKRLAYLSGVGLKPERAFKKAAKFVREYEALAVVVDSMGLAMQGDMDKSAEVLGFHARFINPLRRAGATPLIVDHEGKLQAGERHKDKSPHGSAFKAWAARSVLQFQFEEFREASSELDIRVRQTKTNFGPKIKPIGVRFTFGDEKVKMGTYELPDEEMIEEEARPVKERILAALRLEGATIKQLVQLTGASEGTIRNKLSELRGEGRITDDGRKPATYTLLSSSSPGTGETDDDDNRPRPQATPTLVAEFLANPPDWMKATLEGYRKDPERFLKPLCVAVADAVSGPGAHWAEVKDEVVASLELASKEGG